MGGILGSLRDKTVLMVGSRVGDLTTKYLLLNGVHSVMVSNRSYEKRWK